MTELGISSFPSYTTGTDINASNLTAAAQADYDNAVSMLNSMALTVPLTDPWNAASASTWDNMTLDDWMSANMTTFGGYLELYTAVATFLSAEPPNISLLYFLFYVHSAGTVEALTDDAQQDRIDGGAQAISLALLGALSSTVNVGAAVSEINDLGTEVKVTYGVTAVTAKKVVVAMMPKDADGITFTSGLSATRQGLQSNWGTASGTKISVVYSTPFWRGAGFSGTAFGTDLSFVTDNSPDDASSGILVGFPSAGFMALPAGNREQAAKDELESFFGAAAQSNLDYTETNWDDETTISGCVSPLPMGFLTTYGTALRVPEGNIHWAGTETSEIWTGYMDGAIRSGERVASELTALLSVHERPQIEFDVFPNPCVDRIKINSASAIHGVQIYDLSGKLVKELEDAQQIDLSNIRSGSYSIKVSTDAGVGVQSLIKN